MNFKEKTRPYLLQLTCNNMTCQYHKINYITLGLETKTQGLYELKGLLLSHENLTYIHSSSYLRHLNPKEILCKK